MSALTFHVPSSICYFLIYCIVKRHQKLQVTSQYSKSSIIGTSITVILAIPGLIKYSIYSSNSSIIGISILVIGVPRLSGFRLSGTFFGPSHPDNRGLTVLTLCLMTLIQIPKCKILHLHYYDIHVTFPM